MEIKVGDVDGIIDQLEDVYIEYNKKLFGDVQEDYISKSAALKHIKHTLKNPKTYSFVTAYDDENRLVAVSRVKFHNEETRIPEIIIKDEEKYSDEEKAIIYSNCVDFLVFYSKIHRGIERIFIEVASCDEILNSVMVEKGLVKSLEDAPYEEDRTEIYTKSLNRNKEEDISRKREYYVL